jgi:hypothetical protein
MGQIMEAVMIICFGLAWPVSVYKSYVSKSTKGKSFLFLLIVLAGYAAGLIHVVLDYPGFSYLTVLYLLNTLMIFIDLLLFLRNRKLEFLSETGPEQIL